MFFSGFNIKNKKLVVQIAILTTVLISLVNLLTYSLLPNEISVSFNASSFISKNIFVVLIPLISTLINIINIKLNNRSTFNAIATNIFLFIINALVLIINIF